MLEEAKIGELNVSIVRRPIKNMHLSVFPPAGHVSVSVPEHTRTDLIRVFLLGKLNWIRKQQMQFTQQERESVREYVTRESHTVWGRRYLLSVVESSDKPKVVLSSRKLTLFVRPDMERVAREAVFDKWLRILVREAATARLPRLEATLGVKVKGLFVQRMKTKWGSCNHEQRHIRLNSELARQPLASLEYVLLHEVAHLVEPTHGRAFQALLDKHGSGWREERNSLNNKPVRYQAWNALGV
jgi:predicted metal-dependent hydrolase